MDSIGITWALMVPHGCLRYYIDADGNIQGGAHVDVHLLQRR